MGNTFATAINCMDGRVQLPVIEYIKNRYGVNFVDTITEPGPNKILSENTDTVLIESIKKRVAISTEMHKSKLVVIVGHHDCAGNPADKETQLSHISNSIANVKSWGFKILVIGLWVDENWHVNQVAQ